MTCQDFGLSRFSCRSCVSLASDCRDFDCDTAQLRHNLVHGHLHGGNVLVESKANSIDAKIADTGLHELVDKQISEQIYGVIPFVAPELSAEVRPYCDRPHDSQLYGKFAQNCCYWNPPVFSKLMLLCLNVSPSNRPTVSHIFECLGNRVSNLSSQFDDTDVPS
ncbi:hypothetical protein C1646_758505 [Rhizophagus diaphanus]|nr:hypothetical protein C1646_758505 [Rhizophagus diaphanus] [Rhizophagus sp. MUCL 43196]